MNNDKIILLADSLGSEPEVVPVQPVNIPGEQGQPLRWPSNNVKWGYDVTYKVKLKKFLDVVMTIFGFCHHLGPFIKNFLG